MKSINFLFILTLLWICCWSDASYTNSSSTRMSSSHTSTTTSITQAPVYCGHCALIYEVHAHVWWPTSYTAYTASTIYTIDSGTGATIGSSIKYTPNATAIIGTKLTAYSNTTNWGPVEYTTLNTLGDADLATLVQVNSITMTGTNNGYDISTQFINTTRTGTAMTQCAGAFLGYYGGDTSDKLAGLPAFTQYQYTTVLPFGATWDAASALTYGLDTLASEVATYLHLTVPNCTSYGGGSGTLKIAVTALTTVSMTYVTAAAVVTTSPKSNSYTQPPSTTPTQAAPSPSPPAPPSPTASVSSPTTAAVNPQSPSSSPEQATSFTPATQVAATPPSNPPEPGSSSEPSLGSQQASSANPAGLPNSGEVTTVVQTISGPAGVQIVSQVITIGQPANPAPNTPVSNTGEVTTIVQTISGPAGLQTLSQVTTIGQSENPVNTPGSLYSEELTTIIQTTSGTAGLQTLSQVFTIGIGGSVSGSYTTTIVTTEVGPSGLETISEVATLAIGSYILSVMGIGGGTGAAATSTPGSGAGLGSESGSESNPTATNPGPAAFMGSACGLIPNVGIRFIILGLVYGLLS